jgi:hypothetical protein
MWGFVGSPPSPPANMTTILDVVTRTREHLFVNELPPEGFPVHAVRLTAEMKPF